MMTHLRLHSFSHPPKEKPHIGLTHGKMNYPISPQNYQITTGIDGAQVIDNDFDADNAAEKVTPIKNGGLFGCCRGSDGD